MAETIGVCVSALTVEVARDLTAETFAQAFEHRGRFRGRTDAEASAWLYGIARHQLGRYARTGVVQRKTVERSESSTNADTGTSPPVSACRMKRPRARRLGLALSIAALLVGGACSVPATRAAVDGITESFASWISGSDDKPPGRALEPGDNVPSWFSENGEARLIAKTGGVGLYVRKTDSDEGPRLEFGLGEGVPLAMGGTLEDWRQLLGQHAVVVLGPAPFGPRDFLDERGRAPLLGVTTRDVKRVELRYSEGPPSVGDTGDSGFVLLADAWRPVRELIAYDASGRVLDRADMRGHDMRYLCDKEAGVCPPEASSSGR